MAILNDLAVNGSERIQNDLYIGGGLSINGKSLIDVIYPVGSIYMSVNNVSPANFIGGSWEQIQDKFLLSAGSSYSAGTSSGSASVTLTTSNMPSHSHIFTPSGEIKMDAHFHGLSGHTHSFKPSGTISSTNITGQANMMVHTSQSDTGCLSTEKTGGSDGNSGTTRGTQGVLYFNSTHNHTFIGTSGTTDGNSGNTTSTTPTGSFTGSSGTTSSSGSGTSFSIMPPYLAVYVWKRIA